MKNNNAIVFLLNAQLKDIHNFRQSISLLYNNYLVKYPDCDIICFHEGNFPQEEIKILQDTFPLPLIFQELSFKLPDYNADILNEIPEFVTHPLFPEAKGFGMGYRHMCRFYAGEIFKQDILQNYKYVWRLDTDSFILEPITSDPFIDMSSGDSIYGYINIQHDHPEMVKGLWELAAEYFQHEPSDIFDSTNRETHFRRVYYTNFEIFDMSWFRQNAYQNFYNYIDQNAGIYKYRWGDHAIRYLALHGLNVQHKCLFFKDIVYHHGERYHNRHLVNNF